MTAKRNDCCIHEHDTRSQILIASIRLFAQHGYDGTSIREIVQAAGVTKPVLYYYFKNKEDLYLKLLNEVYSHFFRELEPILTGNGDFITKLKHLAKFYLNTTNEFTDVVRMIYDGLFIPKRNPPPADILWDNEARHLELIKKFFEEGMKTNIIRNENVEQIAIHFLGVVNIYIMTQMSGKQAIPENVDEVIVDYVLHGIGKVKK